MIRKKTIFFPYFNVYPLTIYYRNHIIVIFREGETKAMAVKNDLEILNEYYATAKDMFNTYKNEVYDELFAEFNFKKETVDLIHDMDPSVLESLSFTNLDSMLETLGTSTFELKSLQKNTYQMHVLFLDFVKDTFRKVKEKMAELDQSAKEIAEIEKDVIAFKQSVIDKVNSQEFMEKKEEERNKLIDRINSLYNDENGNESERRTLVKQLEFVNKLENSRFILDRLQEVGDKEIQSILKAFFNRNEGDYLMKKFRAACKQFKLNDQFYSFFLNLEDSFLPEEYYPYNNLFLFVCMRFIAYADANNKMESAYVTRLTNNLVKLFEHRFQSDSVEQAFIEVIKEVDDFFKPYEERFLKDNTTHKKHPKRLEKEEIREKNKKIDLLRKLKVKGVEADESLDSITLQNMLIEREAELKRAQETEVDKSADVDQDSMITSGYVEVGDILPLDNSDDDETEESEESEETVVEDVTPENEEIMSFDLSEVECVIPEEDKSSTGLKML